MLLDGHPSVGRNVSQTALKAVLNISYHTLPLKPTMCSKLGLGLVGEDAGGET